MSRGAILLSCLTVIAFSTGAMAANSPLVSDAKSCALQLKFTETSYKGALKVGPKTKGEIGTILADAAAACSAGDFGRADETIGIARGMLATE